MRSELIIAMVLLATVNIAAYKYLWLFGLVVSACSIPFVEKILDKILDKI